jgi:hypothetical protein
VWNKPQWKSLTVGLLLLLGVLMLLMPSQPRYSPGEAFEISDRGPLNALTVTFEEKSLLSSFLCQDCSAPQPGLGTETSVAQEKIVAEAIAAAELLTGETWEERVPVIVGVAGSSSGLAFALGAWAELSGSRWDAVVAATGTVTRDGVVHQVQGTQAKSVLAQNIGAELLVLPAGNTISENYGGTVAQVENLAQAVTALCALEGSYCPEEAK